jgi:hypothetical protein
VLQQGNNLSGILVRFDAPHSFNLGDSIDVNVSQQELSAFNGLLQMNNIPLSYATVKATGKAITPRTVTLADVAANFEAWESTLVTTGPAALTGGSGGTYSGSVTMNDGATLVLFTSSGATFASQNYPATVVSVTGYLTQFAATNEMAIRNPLSDVVAASGGGTGLPLTASPYTQDFNSIASGLPTGIFVKTGANATSLGSSNMSGTLSTLSAWNGTSGGMKNFASATGLTSASNSTDQNASTNRALGIRQTGSVGDPGASYIFMIDNTIGKTNFQLSFLLQQLDPTAAATPRVATWKVEYGLGDNPASFTAVTTNPATLKTTFSNWSSTPVTVNFGSALNNLNQKIWIRIVALTATTGSGSRPSTAIDDVNLSWQ